MSDPRDTFTKRDYDELLKAYKVAVEKKQTKFIFQQQEVLVSYAYYLLQYLESKFKTVK